MCWAKLFKKKELALPHPEEPVNPQATIKSVDIKGVVKEWYDNWGVPLIHQPFWDDVSIVLVENLFCVINNQIVKVPALTYADTKEVSIDPQWANTGVIAHEMAHISYSLLDFGQRTSFMLQYSECVGDSQEKLFQLLCDTNTYMEINMFEAHAEIYRYLGERMPESLKRFYPKLF